MTPVPGSFSGRRETCPWRFGLEPIPRPVWDRLPAGRNSGFEDGLLATKNRRNSLSVCASVRVATRHDTAAINAVRDQTWAVSYRGIVSDAYLDVIATEGRPRRDPWWLTQKGCHAFVAENAGDVVGCAICGPVREAHLHYTGETYVLYVVPHLQRQGIGQQLIRACAAALTDDGHQSMIVWTFEKGFAIRFYERIGGVTVGHKNADIAGASYEYVACGWDDLGKLAI
jgi:GNAT superfamily N-acetyltransferase